LVGYVGARGFGRGLVRRRGVVCRYTTLCRSEAGELEAFVGIGEIGAAAHPGGELSGGVGGAGRPREGGARAPVLSNHPHGPVVDPPFELIGRRSAGGRGGERNGGPGHLWWRLVSGHAGEHHWAAERREGGVRLDQSEPRVVVEARRTHVECCALARRGT